MRARITEIDHLTVTVHLPAGHNMNGHDDRPITRTYIQSMEPIDKHTYEVLVWERITPLVGEVRHQAVDFRLKRIGSSNTRNKFQLAPSALDEPLLELVRKAYRRAYLDHLKNYEDYWYA